MDEEKRTMIEKITKDVKVYETYANAVIYRVLDICRSHSKLKKLEFEASYNVVALSLKRSGEPVIPTFSEFLNYFSEQRLESVCHKLNTSCAS